MTDVQTPDPGPDREFSVAAGPLDPRNGPRPIIMISRGLRREAGLPEPEAGNPEPEARI